MTYCIELGRYLWCDQRRRIPKKSTIRSSSPCRSLFYELLKRIKTLNAGIKIIEQEESYTSKADITTKDYIPTYGVDDKDAQFSSFKRGLYRCADGTILNADCHAAANIMRKATDIWDRTTDFSFLASPKVMDSTN